MAIKPLDLLAVPVRDARHEQLHSWLGKVLATDDFALREVASDASSRRYFRVQLAAHSLIAMDASAPGESFEQFRRVAEMLSSIGSAVPHIHQYDTHAGFLLMSDLGTRTYYDELSSGAEPDGLYRDALHALVHLQSYGHEQARQLPPYETALLQREAALFTDWFCVRHLQLPLGPDDLLSLQTLGSWLAQQAQAQPRVFVHRDYHSRNLMVREPQAFPVNPGILDFQDALYGPLTYDLVSLLRDCYLDWAQAQVQVWLRWYHQELQRHAQRCDFEQLCRWFDLMGVQRHLKAIGIFARLRYRDGKHDYLEHVPRTLGYVSAVAAQYTELRFLVELLEGRVLPALQAVAGLTTGVSE